MIAAMEANKEHNNLQVNTKQFLLFTTWSHLMALDGK